MPFITTLPTGLVTVDIDTGLISVGETNFLGGLDPSQEFDMYDVEGGGGAATVENGDFLQAQDGDLTSPISGTYAGSGTFSTAAANIEGPLGSSLGTIQVNPVSGHFLIDEDGQAYFISDEPLSGDNIGVTITLLGVETDIPLNELADVPLIGGALGPALDAVGNTLNNTVVTSVIDPEGTLEIPAELVVCFAAGTLIETDRGMVKIEDLRAGDLVATRDNGLQPIKWIGSTSVNPKQFAAMPNLRPIRIQAGALGNGTPSADLIVSPQHRILVRSAIAQKMFGTREVLVAAKQLLQLDGIDIEDDLISVEYYHFMFDQHEVVMSNGAETESLFTGPEALKSVGRAARAEIFTLFPELQDENYVAQGARTLPSGRLGRKLVSRHMQHRKPMVASA